MLSLRFYFLLVVLALLGRGGIAIAQQHKPAADTAKGGLNRIIVAEPGDTISIAAPEASPEDSAEFVAKDTIQGISERDIFDTLDFRNFIPGTPYELIEDRLSCLTAEMPLTYNRTVNSFINFFTVRKRNYTQTMLERKDYYFPMFEEALARYGLPDELKYLAIVESGLNNRAFSRSGAVGLWQFINAAAKDYSLYQDRYIDERMDPRKATDAACRYLRSLYNQFHDWELALAAYNCGPGTIRRTMARSGGRTFWEIYNRLPQETRSYVPQFTAVVYTMHYAAAHNIYPDLDSILRPVETDTIVLERQVNLALLGRHLEVDPAHLIFYNPHLRNPISPEEPGFVLTLPKAAAERFRTKRGYYLDSAAGQPIYELPAPRFADRSSKRRGRRGRQAKEETYDIAGAPEEAQPGKARYHKVRRGETLFAIATKTGASVAHIKHLNHLRGSTVKVGQMLAVGEDAPKHKPKGKHRHDTEHVEAQPETQPAPAIAEGQEEDTQLANAEEEDAPAAVHQGKKKPGKAHAEAHAKAHKTHHVQPGDTLWNIAQRQGITVQQLIRLNHLKDKTLKVGQRLIVG